MKSLSFAFGALLLAAPAVAQSAADAALDRAVKAWANVRTVRASLEQTVVNPLTGRSVTSRGVVQQRRPAKFAVRFSEPAGDVIVADGTTLWLYLPSTTPGQVIRTTLGKGVAASVDLTEQFLAQPRTKYDVVDAGAEAVDGRPARALRLTPKPGQQLPFVRAKVWVDDRDGLVRQFEATDRNGIARKVKLSNVQVNASVKESAFKFTVPKGARVVEQ
ncbi:MAG TPA: outer membrane lipoprotein carrier protein LolA [Gemmatimonadaceae bacterium]|nr:outer membrane lipoprotein carrier protein LolA [Gemmatimonadaceae bacterium]